MADTLVRLGGLLLAAALLSACRGTAPPAEPPVELPAAFSVSGEDVVPPRFWRALDDPQLDVLIRAGLDGNLELRGALARLEAAQAFADRAGAERLPELDATAGVARARDGEADDEREQLDLGLVATWEVDLWGRIRAAARAERLRAAATAADYRAARLSLAATLARSFYQVAEARAQVALLREQRETNATLLELLEARFATGLVRSVDILRQRQLVAATQRQERLAVARLETLEHGLAVLLGEAPGAAGGPPVPAPPRLPELPPLPATGLPAELVQRRPDVRAAWRRLAAADQDLAAAVAARYPRLDLAASVETAGASTGALFDDWWRELSADLLAPVFRGGALTAEVERRRALRRAALDDFGQAVLVALREVEDALTRDRLQDEALARLVEQVELARQAYRQLRFRYFNGASDYLDVLLALDEVQQLRRDLTAARLERVETRIELYRALAGPIMPDVAPAQAGT